MAEFRVGAKGEGVVASLLEVVRERKAEHKERAQALRDWNLELMKLGVKQALDDRTMEPEFDANGIWTGRLKKVATRGEIDPSSLRIGESVTLGQGGRVTSRTLRGPTQPPLLTGAAEEALLSSGEPGTPFMGTVPISPAGKNTLQAAISQGRFESPLVELAHDQQTAGSPSALDFMRSFAARMAGFGIPGNGVSPIRRQPPSVPSPRTVPQRPVAPQLPQTDASQLLSDVTAAIQEGFTVEEIVEQLRSLGIDQVTIDRLLQSTGA